MVSDRKYNKNILLLVRGFDLALSSQVSTRTARFCSQVVGLQCVERGHWTERFLSQMNFVNIL